MIPQLARITALRAFSRENAALPRGRARHPALVFMPGGGMKALMLDHRVRGGINLDGTAGEDAIRELYSDSNEVLFDAQRPLLISGFSHHGHIAQ